MVLYYRLIIIQSLAVHLHSRNHLELCNNLLLFDDLIVTKGDVHGGREGVQH